MPYELCYQFSRFGIPYTDDVLRPAAGEHRRAGPKGIDRALFGRIVVTGINAQDLSAAIKVPQEKLMVKSTRRNPVRLAAGAG